MNPTVTLTLDANECNLVLAALGEIPFKVSAPLIQKIKAQGDEQIAAQSSNVETLPTKEQANG